MESHSLSESELLFCFDNVLLNLIEKIMMKSFGYKIEDEIISRCDGRECMSKIMYS